MLQKQLQELHTSQTPAPEADKLIPIRGDPVKAYQSIGEKQKAKKKKVKKIAAKKGVPVRQHNQLDPDEIYNQHYPNIVPSRESGAANQSAFDYGGDNESI